MFFIDVFVFLYSFVDFIRFFVIECYNFFIVVCLIILFIGKIFKITLEDELRVEFEKYGSLEFINVRFFMSYN